MKIKRHSDRFAKKYADNVLQYIESFKGLDVNTIYADHTDGYAEQIEGKLEAIDYINRVA